MRHRTERRFLPRAESAAAARSFVCETVRESSADRDDVLLLTSELVNNAILHARSEFDVRVDIEDDYAVCVTVLNHAPELLLLAREPSASGGRGLALIDAVANAWGFESRVDTKSVWFRLRGPPGAR